MSKLENTLETLEVRIKFLFEEYRRGSYHSRGVSKRTPEAWLYFDIFFITCEEPASMKTLLDVRKRCINEHPNHFMEIEEQFIFALLEHSQELYKKPFLKVAAPNESEPPIKLTIKIK